MAVLLIAAGCSSTTDGDAVADATSSGAATTTTSAPTPWDPCTIPDEAIERAGLNVDTKESGVFGRDQFGFKICGWENQATPESKYYVRIFVGFQTIDWISDTSRFDRLEPVQIGARAATQFQQVASDSSLDCGVAFTAGTELVMATLNTSALVDRTIYDPCTEVNEIVARLDSELPT
ncbi:MULTISPECIES: DUF3558 domain-containing protein [unclassified Rhodococcus (in: high G+C Gram-positive bacteria)]|uniref:DUF3558 domain-containing protein n=1 Tax=unclassified Rhodococcus (in: high G+C Gram-positive bacteria) TaxID=192944 RepID=UPI00211AC24D|nr:MULTISPECIES: DUF3558 domain-containing protein [unclassified Rhodococcus (in: high G+C Gram-positive bacteria)]